MAELASSSDLRVRYAKELAFGVTPTAGNHKVMSLNSEGLTYEITKTASEELNPDRGVTDMVPTSAAASGPISVEMKASVYDEFIAAGLQNVWQDYVMADLEITVTADSITLTGADVFPEGLQRGQYFGLKVDETSPNYRRLFRISEDVDAITSDTIKLNEYTPGEPETVVTSVLASRLRNGKLRSSFSVEKEFSDVEAFRLYRGMNVDSFSLNAAQGAITSGEFQLMGRDGTATTDETQLPGVAEPQLDMRPMTGMTGVVCAVWLDKAPLVGTYMESIALSYANNLRQQNAMCSADESGVAGAVGIGNGNINTTATLGIYFSKEDTLYEEFVKNRNVELSYTMFDTEGYGYVVTLPKANVSTHTVTATGNNQDVIANVEVTGLLTKSAYAPLNGAVMFIDRIAFP